MQSPRCVLYFILDHFPAQEVQVGPGCSTCAVPEAGVSCAAAGVPAEAMAAWISLRCETIAEHVRLSNGAIRDCTSILNCYEV
jgi:hypothetical protein